MRTVLRANLDRLETSREDLPAQYEKLGGRALTSALVHRSVDVPEGLEEINVISLVGKFP